MEIQLSHGAGGAEMTALIEAVFMKHFRNEINAPMNDAAILPLRLSEDERLVFTTDSFVVEPLFFAGGDIGRLAVCGTVNDLLTAGGKPLFLSASFILEEGLPVETLERAAQSMQETACEAGVQIVTGDTKVVGGKGGLLINTAGIGVTKAGNMNFQDARPGDAVLVTGNLGDHHAAILSARLGVQNGIRSDAAPLCAYSKLQSATVRGAPSGGTRALYTFILSTLKALTTLFPFDRN
jgi:hydrogenase expression/formation protein HypE